MRQYLAVGRCLIALGTMLSHKLDLCTAVKTVAESEPDPQLRSCLLHALAKLRKGGDIGEVISSILDGDVSALQSFLLAAIETRPGWVDLIFLGDEFFLHGNCHPKGEVLFETCHLAMKHEIPLHDVLEHQEFFYGTPLVLSEGLASLFGPDAPLAQPIVELIQVGEENGYLPEVFDKIKAAGLNREYIEGVADSFLTLGLLCEYGLPVHRAIALLERSWTTEATVSAVAALEGRPLFRSAMGQLPGIFSPVWVEMLDQAETAGNISRTCQRLGELIREGKFALPSA